MSKFKKSTVLLAMVLTCNLLTVPSYATQTTNPGTTQTTPAEKTVSFTDVNEIVYSRGNVNVRTGPGMDYDVITTLRYGQAIQRTGIGDNGWSRVSYNGKDAYMYTSLLTTKDPAGAAPGGDGVDTSRLSQQIAIAKGLEEREYTRETWKAMTAALGKAAAAQKSTSQETIDAAATALEKAIAALHRMNYTALEQAIAAGEEQVAASADYALVTSFRDLLNKAQELRSSGDQEAVDQCAAELNAMMADFQDWLERSEEPEIVIQEVEIEVPPTDDYCNIPIHRIWFVAFLASMVLNVMLVLIIAVLMTKKRYQAEDVPLVDYDIDDDL